jgi:hypothetical protein
VRELENPFVLLRLDNVSPEFIGETQAFGLKMKRQNVAGLSGKLLFSRPKDETPARMPG